MSRIESVHDGVLDEYLVGLQDSDDFINRNALTRGLGKAGHCALSDRVAHVWHWDRSDGKASELLLDQAGHGKHTKSILYNDRKLNILNKTPPKRNRIGYNPFDFSIFTWKNQTTSVEKTNAAP
jgi:hypothetical protein